MKRLLRFFAPDNKEFYRLFAEAGENLAKGADLLVELVSKPDSERKEVAKRIGICEHDGDKIIAEINDRLNRTFVTPFEREDIYELASTLDDVLDYIEDTADYIVMYKLMKSRYHVVEQAELIAKSAHEISQALAKLDGFKGILPHITAVKDYEHQGDKLVRSALADLFENEDRFKRLVAWKDVYEALENTLNHAEHHVNVLKGIMVRNS